MKAYFYCIYNWRKVIICFYIVVLSLVSLGALKLQFTTNYRVFFSEENPQLHAYLRIQQVYNKKDNILFVLSNKQGDVFSSETLTAVSELTSAGWLMHKAVRVDSVTNFQFTEADFETVLIKPLVEDPATLNQRELLEVKDIAINEPQLLRRLINKEADVTGINVTFDLAKGEEIEAIPKIAVQAESLVSNLQKKYPHLTIHLTGTVMMDHALTKVPMQDMVKLVPLMFVLIAFILFLSFRNKTAVFVTLLLLLFTIGTVMGVAGWFGLLLSPPTAVVPIIIMTVAVADSVHILVSYQNALAKGESRNEALLHSLIINIKAIVLTSLTTIIGFLGLNYSDVPPFRELGNLVALGALLAFVLTISFLPALLLILPVQKKVHPVIADQLMQKIGEFVVKKKKMVLISTVLLSGLIGSFLVRNELNDEFIKYFDETVNFRRATDFAVNSLTGLYVLEFEIDTLESEGVTKLQNLKLIEALSRWLRLQKEVIHVDTISDVIKRINKNLYGDDQEKYRLPDTSDLAAQEILLYEMSLPYGLDLNDKLNIQKSATRVSVSLENLSSSEVLSFVNRVSKWFKAHETNNSRLTISGAPLMFAHISERNIKSMLGGTSLVLIGISLILLLVFKSIKIGLFSLLPNLAPAVLAFGLWGLVVGQIGMTLAVVSCMTLGIVVDDTVHFLTKYLHIHHVQNIEKNQAVIRTFTSVGSALLITSCALISGFLVLSFSSFVPNADMGLLASFTILFALLADFFILPPLLLFTEK